MNKTANAVMAMILAAAFGAASVAYAAKHEGAGNDAVAKACKDKKPGETVKVDGKDVKCPEMKKK
jgi:hypothetical protein